MKSERKRYFGKRKEKALIFAALFVELAFLSVGCASATTHYVNPGELIQAEVGAADPGDTIIVRDGTYIENVDVYKRLTIQSENGSENCIVQAANPDDHVFEVTADYVNISGFTVKGAIEPGKSGISLYSNHCNVSNNHGILNNLSISLWSSNNNIITDNVVYTNWIGIYLKNSSNNTIIYNNASSNDQFGIELWNSTNNIISNNEINMTVVIAGILLSFSNNNIIEGNNVSNNYLGIIIFNSSYNQITDNTANNNTGFKGEIEGQPPSTGILILGSHNIIRNNNASNNYIGIAVFSEGPTGDIVSVNNTIEGNIVKNNTGIISENKPSSSGILLGASSNIVRKNKISDNFFGIAIGSGPNGVILTNNTISNNDVSNNTYGISLANSSYSVVENNIANNNIGFEGGEYMPPSFSILLYKSNHNTINNNTANFNNISGIILVNSSYNKISHNTVSSNNATGMAIQFSDYNTISDNFAIFNAGDGIWLWNASHNIISGNNASNNTVHNGISLGASSNNTVINNMAYSNYHNGINLYNGSCNNIVANNTLVRNEAHGISAHNYSNFNKIYHNNLINNSQNAIDESLNNSWDNGYPSGGNYWSDYTGVDNYSGPKQDIPGSDGIGDTPYNIPSGVGAKDRYPLMTPYSEKDIFDTGTGTYPSIMGTHKGTIIPSRNINVSRLYTYPCVGTGGHTESIELYENGNLIASGTWNGYKGDWHNITITSPVTLLVGHTYNYTIVTGSYPQIIHAKSKEVTGGTITCTVFVDANGKVYIDWIPAMRLCE